MKLGVRVSLAMAAPCLCAVAWAGSPSWSYEQPKVLAGEFHIASACMMPAEGHLTKVGMKGGEGMSKESDAWSTALQTVVESHLKSAGVQLMPASSVLSSGASDDELNQILLQVQGKYDDIATQINRKPKDIGKSRFTLGDDVLLLPCAAKSDVLVFVGGGGQVLTGGKKAMGLLVGGQASSVGTLILAMADAKSGEILAYVRVANVSDQFLTDPEKAFGTALDKQLKRMKIGTTATASHKGH